MQVFSAPSIRALLVWCTLAGTMAAVEPDWAACERRLKDEDALFVIDQVLPTLAASDGAVRFRAALFQARAQLVLRDHEAVRAILALLIHADGGHADDRLMAYQLMVEIAEPKDPEATVALCREGLTRCAGAQADGLFKMRLELIRRLIAVASFDQAEASLAAMEKTEVQTDAVKQLRLAWVRAELMTAQNKRAEAEQALSARLGQLNDRIDDHARLETILRLVRSHERHGKFNDAITLLQTAESRCPHADVSEMVAIPLHLGKQFHRTRKYEEAISTLLEGDRRYTGAWLIRRSLLNWEIIQVYRRMGDHLKAREQMLLIVARADERLLQMEGKPPAAQYRAVTQLLWMLRDGGERPTAIRHLRWLIERLPDRTPVLRRLALSELLTVYKDEMTRQTAAHRHADTRALGEEALDVKGWGEADIRTIVDVVLEDIAADGALADIEAAVAKANAFFADAGGGQFNDYGRIGIARLLHRRGRGEEALAACGAILADSSVRWHGDALLLMAQIHAKALRHDQAYTVLDDLVNRFPDHDAAWNGRNFRGWLLLMQGRRDEARDVLKGVVHAKPGHPAAVKAAELLTQLPESP